MMTRKLHHSAVRVLATLAVAFVSGGCAMKGDIRTLQEELRAVSARQDSLMAGLRAETRQTQDTLRVQGDQMFDLRGDLNRQLQQINEAVPMGTGLPTDSATAAGGESLIGGAGNPDELWGVAQAQYQRQSLNSAAAAFEQFIAEHPSDARVPNAHFFLADILVQQGQPEEALEAFEEIQALFPTHERVPEALYRIAELQIELGDEDAARLTLERIVNTYPGTTMAMLARDKLEEIG
ncbi:MAG: hypothetical protein AMS19_06915 [Gemmatimonas sp. SG8_23]|nr:MAG: hypothetical protein AMS19_06915 [Gemmatimonas sp. SG8_23]